MNTQSNSIAIASNSASYLRELSQRVQRLEFLRSDACAHRDPVRVAFIDRQIKNTVLEWCDSFVRGIDTSARNALKVYRTPSLTVI